MPPQPWRNTITGADAGFGSAGSKIQYSSPALPERFFVTLALTYCFSPGLVACCEGGVVLCADKIVTAKIAKLKNSARVLVIRPGISLPPLRSFDAPHLTLVVAHVMRISVITPRFA